jgi:uncharacterized protein YndB with AHSA1/START domain
MKGFRWAISKPVIVETALSPEEVSARLTAAVLPWRVHRGEFLDAASEGDFPVAGWVKAHSCRLHYHSVYRRGGGRSLYLRFEGQGTGTKLDGEFRFGLDAVLPPLAVALLAIWRVWNPTGRGGGLAIGVLCGLGVVMLGVVAELGQLYWTRQGEQVVLKFVEDTLLDRPLGTQVPAQLRGEVFPITDSARPGRVDIRVSQQFSMKPSEVYRAFLNASVARTFLFATETGTMVRAEINARVGGEFTFVDRRDGVDVLHTGHYVALGPGRCISFDFKVPMFSDASATVTMELWPVWQGCEVVLMCEGVLPEWGESTREGWSGMLKRAARVLAKDRGRVGVA